jgi:hypothetical protein
MCEHECKIQQTGSQRRITDVYPCKADMWTLLVQHIAVRAATCRAFSNMPEKIPRGIDASMALYE